MTTPLASAAVVERIAAAFHTLVRGWHYDPARYERATAVRGEIPLDPWVATTDDPDWLSRGETTVDIAATWWEDLPTDWRARFTELALEAGNEVVAAAQAGWTPIDLVGDDIFLRGLGARLQPEWLDPPRVIALKGGVVDRDVAGAVLARVAVHVYARQVAGFEGTLGTVPILLPSEFPDRSTMIKVGGPQPRDSKHVSFSVRGDRLTAAVRARLTELIGYAPDASFSRGALNLQRTTGKQYRPYQTGLWSLDSDEYVLAQGPTLEDHILWLLAVLEPHRTELQRLIAEHELDAQFGCCYSQTDFNAEWVLSARTVRRMADLGASFWFDSYRSDDDEEDDEGGEGRGRTAPYDRPALPPAVSAIKEISLHDGLIERLTVNETKRTITLELVIGDLQRGYQRARIKYRDATLSAVCADLRWLVEYKRTELLSDEIVDAEDGFRHRLVFWPAGELHIEFGAVEISLDDAPDRTRRGPKLRWR